MDTNKDGGILYLLSYGKGFSEVSEIGELTVDQFIEYVKENSRTKPYPLKSDVADKFDVNKKTVRNKAKKAIREDLILEKDHGNTRSYLHVDNDNDVESEVERLIEKSSGILGNRNPTLEEVAKLGNFDEQDEQFREVFYDILQSKGMREPESDILEEKNEKTVMKIENCVLIDDGLMKYIDQEDEKEKQEWARKYRDKLKDHIDVTYADRDEGIPQRVYIDFDEELEILLGQSATSRDI
jgi:hypothetical protein